MCMSTLIFQKVHVDHSSLNSSIKNKASPREIAKKKATPSQGTEEAKEHPHLSPLKMETFKMLQKWTEMRSQIKTFTTDAHLNLN